jgi:Ca2+-binding RTX toxin-like protein
VRRSLIVVSSLVLGSLLLVVPPAVGVTCVDLTTHDDVYIGDATEECVNGLEGADRIYLDDVPQGGSQSDTANGGRGSDYLVQKQGAAFLTGGSGADELHSGADPDALDGGCGNDMLYGQGRVDSFHENFTCTGDSGNDYYDGGPGAHDRLTVCATGGAGTDTIVSIEEFFVDVAC